MTVTISPEPEREEAKVRHKHGGRYKVIYLVQFTTGAKHYENQSY